MPRTTAATQLLAEAGIASTSIRGPEAAYHLEAAMSVASGQADTGLGIRAAATALGLGFVPVIWEDFDIVLSGDALRNRAVQSSIALGGYDLTRVGFSGNAGLIDISKASHSQGQLLFRANGRGGFERVREIS